MMADWMIFLESFSAYWWVADLLILFFIQSLTVWFYKSIANYNLSFLPPIAPYMRSLLYLSLFIALFFIYIPQQIFILMDYFQMPIQAHSFPDIAYVLCFISVALGGWATYEFARAGRGTPVPLDDPQFLITSGPYLFMSNPMQMSGILLTLAVLCWNVHWIYFIYLIDVALVVWLIFERMESLQLSQAYGKYFQDYQKSVGLWKIHFFPQKLPQTFRPILFIDQQCSICVQIVEWIKKWDFADNLSIQSLQSLIEKPSQHTSLKPLAQSKTTMILAQPRVNKEGSITFLYSQKGRATLRLFGYMPMPICFIAALEGLPLIPQISDGLYILYTKIRKYL